MTTGASATGQAFAIRNCDALFSYVARGISFEETVQHVANVKALARQRGREIDVYTVGVVTCRATAREAAELSSPLHRRAASGCPQRGLGHQAAARRRNASRLPAWINSLGN
jgi:alkanesulfonate monooxygenase SsuD/methylene tetrahydromethanopterin reductase-like flavin-dependent oxidoreductase (luciferase family)